MRTLVSRPSDSRHHSRAAHPASRRCSSLRYAQYPRSSRLAIRARRSATSATNHWAGTLVVGIGQALRRDDGVGLAVARRLSALGTDARVVCCEGDCAMLLAAWDGADRVIAIDAVSSGRPPGTITRLDASTAPLPATRRRSSTHALGLAEVLELARTLGHLPGRIVVFGVEGRDFGPGEGLSPDVARAVDAVVAEVAALVGAAV